MTKKVEFIQTVAVDLIYKQVDPAVTIHRQDIFIAEIVHEPCGRAARPSFIVALSAKKC